MAGGALIWLLACGERAPLANEERELATIDLGSRSYRWSATLRAWSHGLSLSPSDLHLPYEAVYVGWEVSAPRAAVKGSVDQTWALGSVEEGRQRLGALTLSHCEGDGLLAYRVLPEEPWRVLVPDEAGAAGGLATGTSCEAALAWAGSPAGWRRDRASNLAVCAHFYRSRRLDEAVRCLLREPERAADAGRASRQDLPRAPDDPAFDGALLAVLDPQAEGDRTAFSPSRVQDLLAEVSDREQVSSLALRYQAVAERLPWQQAIVDAVPSEAVSP